MAINRISRAFKDISLSFTPHPVTKDLTILKNENAIKKSVRNLVQTIPTERFFNSVLGSEVRDSLVEFVDFGTASVIQDQILNEIKKVQDLLGLSLIYISHDIAVIAEMTDKIAVMYAGSIVEMGPTKDIFEILYIHTLVLYLILHPQ